MSELRSSHDMPLSMMTVSELDAEIDALLAERARRRSAPPRPPETSPGAPCECAQCLTHGEPRR